MHDMLGDDSYTGALLEEIRDQNKAVLEAVGQVQDQVKKLASQESLDTLDVKVTTIQKAVTATNQDVADHERRITALEAA